ncbi:four-helix bundle copper-binding protein [soil metagenome]
MSNLDQCIQNCQDCYRVCLDALTNHCLKEGGAHTEQGHVKLMLDCIQICQTSADFMIRQSASHGLICRACSEICRTCADDCERVGGMEECVSACRKCAESCGSMAA